MSFKALDAFLDDTLTLPVTAEKKYVIQPVDAAVGLWVERISALAVDAQQERAGGPKIEPLTPDEVAALKPPGGDRKTLTETILGDALQEMLDDGVSHEVVKLVTATTMVWITAGKDEAEKYWNAGGRPKARKAPQDRAKPKKKAPRA